MVPDHSPIDGGGQDRDGTLQRGIFINLVNHLQERGGFEAIPQTGRVYGTAMRRDTDEFSYKQITSRGETAPKQ